MSKDSVAHINGHDYKYRYNKDTGRMDYGGPVGDAPKLTEAQFREAMMSRTITTQEQLRRKISELKQKKARPSEYIQFFRSQNLTDDDIGEVLSTSTVEGDLTGLVLRLSISEAGKDGKNAFTPMTWDHGVQIEKGEWPRGVEKEFLAVYGSTGPYGGGGATITLRAPTNSPYWVMDFDQEGEGWFEEEVWKKIEERRVSYDSPVTTG